MVDCIYLSFALVDFSIYQTFSITHFRSSILWRWRHAEVLTAGSFLGENLLFQFLLNGVSYSKSCKHVIFSRLNVFVCNRQVSRLAKLNLQNISNFETKIYSCSWKITQLAFNNKLLKIFFFSFFYQYHYHI
jgi:hypothetical protein